MHNFFLTLILFVVLGFQSLYAQNALKLINGFDTQKEIDKWQIRNSRPPTKWSLNTNPKYITNGKGSAKLVTPSARNGGPRWPAVILHHKFMPFIDFSAYDYLCFDVINPKKTAQRIRVHFVAFGGAVCSVGSKVNPGKQRIKIPLPKILKESRIHQIHLFQSIPSTVITLYIDNLCVEVDRESLQKNLNEFKSVLITSQNDSDIKEKRHLQHLIYKANILIEACKSSSQLVFIAKKFNTLKKEYKSWLKSIRKIACNKLINRFNAKFKGKTWGYAWTHGIIKIFRNNFPFKANIGRKLKIKLAQNESEGIQLILRSNKMIEGVKVVVSDLKNNVSSAVLQSSNIKVFPVGYVKTLKASYPVEYIKWRPDPLLNFLPVFTLDANAWQPIWLDVRIPENVEAGTYIGRVTVSGKNLQAMEIPIQVDVWNFALPKTFSLKSMINCPFDSYFSIFANNPKKWGAKLNKHSLKHNENSADGKLLRKIQLKIEDTCWQHRFVPINLYRNNRFASLSEYKRTSRNGLNPFNLIYISSIRGLKTGEKYPGWRKKYYLKGLKKLVPELKKAGLLRKAYIYAFDEIKEEQFTAAVDILSEIKKLYPEIRIMTTAFDKSFGKKSGLTKYIDVWIPGTTTYVKNFQKIKKIRKTGKKVWWYTCAGPYPPSLNLLLEQVASAPRLLSGFGAAKYNTDGFLYYQTTKWPFNIIINQGPLTNHSGRSNYHSFNGDGMLFYPGIKGPMPSIRLKALRDGFEDYEYYTLLKNKVRDAEAGKIRIEPTLLANAKRLLKIKANVCKSLTKYDRKGNKVLAYRNQIGNLLSKINSSK